jgi:hypothetical protein
MRLVESHRGGDTSLRNDVIDAANTSLSSPATMWPAPATTTGLPTLAMMRDLLKTAQFGISTLVMGDRAAAGEDGRSYDRTQLSQVGGSCASHRSEAPEVASS